MQTSGPKILIYGSCVTRDIQRISDDRFRVLDYIARQSFVSANSPSLPDPDTSAIAGKFLARAIASDFASNAFERIISNIRKSDVLLIDLASERHGVVPYQNSLISRTNDLAKSGLLTPREFNKHIAFDTPEHRKKFRAAAIKLKEELMREKAFRKTLVIATPFTDVTSDGSKMPLSRGKTAEMINNEYAYYYELLRNMGFAILTLPDELCVASPSHKWGISQNHYVSEAYGYLADQIELFMAEPVVAKRVFKALNSGRIFRIEVKHENLEKEILCPKMTKIKNWIRIKKQGNLK